jgi:hypothetical protein
MGSEHSRPSSLFQIIGNHDQSVEFCLGNTLLSVQSDRMVQIIDDKPNVSWPWIDNLHSISLHHTLFGAYLVIIGVSCIAFLSKYITHAFPLM